MRSLVDVDPEPTLVVGLEGRILYANRSIRTALRRSTSELVGKELTSVVHPNDQSDLRDFLEEVGSTGVVGGSTVRFQAADDTWPTYYLLSSTIGDTPDDRRIMLRAASAHDSRHDPLTGMLDRDALIDRLDKILARNAHENRLCGVVFVNIGHLKAINTSHGWSAGNQILKTIAKRLAQVHRPTDVAGRLGGSGFGVILDAISDPDGAQQAAGRIRSRLAEPIEVGGDQIVVTVRIGAAVGRGDSDGGSLFARAEEAASALDGTRLG